MKNLLIKIYKKIGVFFGLIENRTNNKVLYTIGNVKNQHTMIDGLIPQAVKIGDNFTSAPNSIILAHDASTHIHTKKHRVEETVIGDNVFLGAGAIILPGVNVGNGAIIGAGAIVTKDVAANTIVAGNPARFICNVDQYIEKCQNNNTLFDTPESFDSFYRNELNDDHVKEFQEKYLSEKKNEKK